MNIWIVIGDKDKLGLYFPSDIKTTYGTDRRYSIRSQLYFVDKKSNQLTQVLGRGSLDLKFQVKEMLFISNINIANNKSHFHFCGAAGFHTSIIQQSVIFIETSTFFILL